MTTRIDKDRVNSRDLLNNDESGRTATAINSPTRPTSKRSSTDKPQDGSLTDVEMIDGRPRDEFDRFTRSQKRRMTAIVSFSALLSRKSLISSRS
jgi:hypothetical protein